MASDQDLTSVTTQHRFFDEWINLQNNDHSELLEALSLSGNDPSKNDSLSQLIEKNMQHFQDYIDERTRLGRDKVSVFYAPAWCTSLENSLLWIGGCRPSMFIRLVYALCGFDETKQLGEFLPGGQTGKAGSTLSEFSASQLTELDNLQLKTIRAEDKVTTRLATFQEEIADQPLVLMAKKASRIDELNDDMSKALDEHEKCMARVLEEADQLRINTLKEVINILETKQAVDFLATSKKLHLCVHAWGRKRDEMRSNQENQEQK